MDLAQLRDHTCACLQLLTPGLGDASLLVDECFTNALKSFREDFMCQLRPEAWAKITLTYYKHFLDTGCEVSIITSSLTAFIYIQDVDISWKAFNSYLTVL